MPGGEKIKKSETQKTTKTPQTKMHCLQCILYFTIVFVTSGCSVFGQEKKKKITYKEVVPYPHPPQYHCCPWAGADPFSISYNPSNVSWEGTTISHLKVVCGLQNQPLRDAAQCWHPLHCALTDGIRKRGLQTGEFHSYSTPDFCGCSSTSP